MLGVLVSVNIELFLVKSCKKMSFKCDHDDPPLMTIWHRARAHMGAAILYGHVTPNDRPVTVKKFRDKVSVGRGSPSSQKKKKQTDPPISVSNMPLLINSSFAKVIILLK